MSIGRRISIRGLAVLALAAGGASAGELQMSVLGSGGIQEESATPEVTLLGMPFSPHQIAVISVRVIARCVCVRSMDDLVLGSHTHD